MRLHTGMPIDAESHERNESEIAQQFPLNSSATKSLGLRLVRAGSDARACPWMDLGCLLRCNEATCRAKRHNVLLESLASAAPKSLSGSTKAISTLVSGAWTTTAYIGDHLYRVT